LAAAIARVRSGLLTTTRPACSASSSAMAQVFAVASRTTASSGPSPAAKARRSAGVALIRPSRRTSPPGSMAAASANWRPTSNPMLRIVPPPHS
jgi:hypothetical protein